MTRDPLQEPVIVANFRTRLDAESAAGLLATFPAVAGFQKALPKGWFPGFYIKPQTIVWAAVAGLIIGWVAALIPARRMVTTRIAEGLRHVG